MKYIFLNNDNTFGFKDENINSIAEEDVQLSDEIYNQFFQMQAQGHQYGINNINGSTFEEIFTEVVPSEPSQIDMLKQQLTELDEYLPRHTEDIINALGMDITKLPQIMQDRLKQKQDLRTQLQQLLQS